MFVAGRNYIFKHNYSNCLMNCKRYLAKTHYDTLGVSKNSTEKEIKEAFIKLSKKYHPDKNTTSNAQAKFVKVLEAYNVLSKSVSRRNYDCQLHNEPLKRPGTPKAQAHAARRAFGYGYDDPNFWANRDKSRDGMYQGASYYGIRGVNRVSNRIIALMCFAIATIGVTLQVLAIRKSLTFQRDVLQQKSLENEAILAEIKEQAERNGNEMQIELLERRFQENKHIRPKLNY